MSTPGTGANKMIATMEVQPDARPRKRAASRPATRQPAEKAKCTLMLSVEASQRLSVHAAMMGEDRSALVDRLIREGLREYVVQRRTRPEASTLPAEENRQADSAA
jgi:hypothetical protein